MSAVPFRSVPLQQASAPSVDRMRAAGLAEAPRPIERIAARTGQGLVFLRLDEVLAFEARERLQFVHSTLGRFDVDASLDELERRLAASFLRTHRNWLASLAKVRKLESREGLLCVELEGPRDSVGTALWIPVSKELRTNVRHRLLAGTIGLRPAKANLLCGG
jgi:DNA-binding LytR/AlgR family response regulator